ncbi:uncharacterized protein K02A2.6-like [Haliotis rufescens]|uniref:uncharacterized protein K02A2.6-like n=1 Tax=Haliotis rufescens TaxID=6454 RepID=UPI001EB049B9|nr:uncharacterized protein K02A2.6-like [Haliotis rufescens]
MYLIVVDYFSRYAEIAKLSSTTSTSIINNLKSIFSRHGIPETVISDNGPQYASAEFREFASKYNFSHVTSSPLYARSNGEAERAVQSCKNILRKAEDPHLAMLVYRTTPLTGRLSPSELLMGRKLRTCLPKHPIQLQPTSVNHEHFQDLDSKQKLATKHNHDLRHRVKTLQQLNPGDSVWLNKSESKVVRKADAPRCYIVNTPNGEVRRNRSDLRKIPTPETSRDKVCDSEFNQNTDCNITPQCLPGTPNRQTDTKTRVGRISRPPQRLDL